MSEHDAPTEETAVITGGAQGLGPAAARALRERGSRIALWDMDPDALAAAATSLGGEVSTREVNVVDAEAVASATADEVRALGRIDVLVHSAGIAGPNAPTVDYPLDEWRRVIDVDLNGAFYGNRAVAAPWWRPAAAGSATSPR